MHYASVYVELASVLPAQPQSCGWAHYSSATQYSKCHVIAGTSVLEHYYQHEILWVFSFWKYFLLYFNPSSTL
jgi:hypothetical protein